MKKNLQYKSEKINITPDFSCVLMGSEDHNRSSGIFTELEANIMVFRSGEKCTYFISLDTLFITNELNRSINELINKTFGNTNEVDIIPIASHTHYAPALEEKRTKLGKKDDKYYSFLLTQLETLVHKLKSIPFVEVELKYSEKVSEGITCNRRRRARRLSNYFKSFIAMEPNPKGFINERFSRLNIYNTTNNEIMGTMWSFPCHPTNFPNKTLISSEFPGEVRTFIRKSKQKEVVVIYFPGFAGDVRATPPKRKSLFKFLRTIFQLSYPVSYYRFNSIAEYTKWCDVLVESFSKIDSNETKFEYDELTLETKISKEPLKSFGIEVDEITNLQFRKVKIGPDFAIYTLSAEPVGEYSDIFQTYISEKFSICTGYTDSVFGYLPTQNQVNEGGYESGEFFDAFLVKGKFNNKIEETVISHVKKFNNVR